MRLAARTAIAIGVLAIVAGLVGWLIAGRALRPIRLITRRARSASANDLSVRVDLEGPNDELKHLADTFDDMLDRLDRSFVAQRRFSAQVSHELRTPLAVVRSEADILLAEGESEASRATAENIKSATLRAERIISALLALGRAESGRIDHSVIALDELVGETVAEVLENRQWVRIHVGTDDGGFATIEVANSTAPRQARAVDSHGIGLTVIAAAAAAHGGSFEREDEDPERVVARVHLPTGDTTQRDDEPAAATSPAASSLFVTDVA